MNIKVLIVILCLMVSSCRTSSGLVDSSPNHFKWYVDEFWEEGRLRLSSVDVYVLADRHCQQFNKRAAYQRFPDIQWLKYYEYQCIPKDQFICAGQLLSPCTNTELEKNNPNNQQKDTKRISAAEDKCVGLGFTRATEKFGECVLQLSK